MDYQKNCTVVGNYEARLSMVPKKWPSGLPLSPYSIPMDDPPQISGATCNFAMPDSSTRERYLWVRHRNALRGGSNLLLGLLREVDCLLAKGLIEH